MGSGAKLGGGWVKEAGINNQHRGLKGWGGSVERGGGVGRRGIISSCSARC